MQYYLSRRDRHKTQARWTEGGGLVLRDADSDAAESLEPLHEGPVGYREGCHDSMSREGCRGRAVPLPYGFAPMRLADRCLIESFKLEQRNAISRLDMTGPHHAAERQHLESDPFLFSPRPLGSPL